MSAAPARAGGFDERWRGLVRNRSARAHLRASDPRLARLIDDVGPLPREPDRRDVPDDAYETLLRAIVGQQLSMKAARTIWGRFVGPYGGAAPAPERLLAADTDALRAIGLSRAKVTYVRSLAEHVISGQLELEQLGELPDVEVVTQLTAVSGIGRWSADMFLIFHLVRPDVLPLGDLGIRRAIERLHGLDAPAPPRELERLAEPWRPWRSLASLYLWESLAPAMAPG